MKPRFFQILFVTLALAFAARGGTVYETQREFLASGDFNGEGIADVLVVDKVTGNARVGYANSAGALNWSSALPTGVDGYARRAVANFRA